MLCCGSTVDERSAGNRHATFCGSRGGSPPLATRWEARLLYSEEGRPGMADYLPDPHGQSAIAMAMSSIDRTDQRPERRR